MAPPGPPWCVLPDLHIRDANQCLDNRPLKEEVNADSKNGVGGILLSLVSCRDHG